MHINWPVITFAILVAAPALAQNTPKTTTESRNAALAYIGTQNYVVGRVATECLQSLGRTEAPKDFVAVWQKRNQKFIDASGKYMQVMLVEAEQAGGKELHDTSLRTLLGVVRSNAEKIVSILLDHPDRSAACTRVVGFMDRGAYDFSEATPIYKELVALVEWASQ